MSVSDSPHFEEGERVVVFLKRNGNHFVVAGRDGAKFAPPLAGTVTATSYRPATLAPGVTYYWRAVAKTSAGTATSVT